MLLLLRALLGPIEIQLVRSVNHCSQWLSNSKANGHSHDRKKVFVLMTSLGTSSELCFLTRIDKVLLFTYAPYVTDLKEPEPVFLSFIPLLSLLFLLSVF